jgi:FkbM family methyltransferase
LYTLAAARRCGEHGRVVAFEPVSKNAAMLRRHLALNDVTNVTVIEAAVSDRAGTLRMSPGDSLSEFHVDAAGELTVPAVTLDESCARAAGLPPPAVIKIDVEGAEIEVLRGAARLIASARPRIYLAVHGEAPARTCREILEAAGYTLTTASGQRWPFEASEWIAIPG